MTATTFETEAKAKEHMLKVQSPYMFSVVFIDNEFIPTGWYVRSILGGLE